MFTDTHCHIYKEYYDDINQVINESVNNNVTRWINNGCDRLSNKEVLDLINKYPNMYGALGVHPENVQDYAKEDLELIEKHINNPKIIAVGEIGLDYHYSKDNKEEQKNLLEYQLKLALKYNKPVIIHSREATLDTLNILRKYNIKGVIHSFSGSLETAKEYIKMGYLLGINGVVTFKNANLKDTLREIPLDNIILETDSPYLTPEPNRGKQNSPKYILDIAKYLCDIYNVSLDELSKVTNNNIKRIFNI